MDKAEVESSDISFMSKQKPIVVESVSDSSKSSRALENMYGTMLQKKSDDGEKSDQGKKDYDALSDAFQKKIIIVKKVSEYEQINKEIEETKALQVFEIGTAKKKVPQKTFTSKTLL